MELALLSAVSAAVVAVITGIFAFRGKRGENHVNEVGTIFDGYQGMVTALQNEVNRQHAEIKDLRRLQDECEAHTDSLEAQISVLRETVEGLERAIRISDR